MKNKRFDSVKYIIAKNARRNGSSIIYHWISMMMTGTYAATADAALECVDVGEGCVSRQMLVWI